MLTGRVLDAAEAQGWGLVTTVTEDAELAGEVASLSARLAAGPPFALGQARRLVRSSWSASRTESGTDEARTISRAITTPEAAALIARFAGR